MAWIVFINYFFVGIPITNIRRSRHRLIFKMGIPIPCKTVFILKQVPISILAIVTNSYPVSTMIIILPSFWIACKPYPRTSFIQEAQIKEKHQTSASLVFVRGIHRWPENVSIWWCYHVFQWFLFPVWWRWYDEAQLFSHSSKKNG